MADDLHVIIFVDGLGYAWLDRTPFVNSLETVRPVRPGIGYSINIQTELFSGELPDELGLFCEYRRRSPKGSLSYRSLAAAMRAFSWNRRLSALQHKVLTRLGLPVAQIPFEYLSEFEHVGYSVFTERRGPILPQARIVSWTESKRPYGDRDVDTVESILASLREEQDLLIVGTLVDIDAIGHIFGPGSFEHDSHLELLDQRLEQIYSTARQVNERARITIVSDHGQSKVDKATELRLPVDLRRELGTRLSMFVDSTIIRFWSSDRVLDAEVKGFASSIGTVVSDADRKRFGIENVDFGTVVVVADDGTLFHPNFMSGYHMPRGMHGYWPDLESQTALFADSARFEMPDRIVASDVPRYLQL